MVARRRAARAFLSAVLLFSAAPAQAEQEERSYKLSTALAQPVVRILSDDYEADGTFRNGTGVLVGRCDILLTARHVAQPGDSEMAAGRLQVYSPQVRGKVVSVMDDPAARALWPADARSKNPGNFDGDIAVLKLSACPTHSYVPLEAIRPIAFADFKALKSVGFACDSGHKRGPEELTLTATFQDTAPALGLSRKILLTPGARSGQSGSPIYALKPGKDPALTMIMAATVRDVAAPVGCGKDPDTGMSEAGSASYGAALTSGFIEALAGYVRGVE